MTVGGDADSPLVLKLGGSAIEDLPAQWWDGVAQVARRRKVVCVHGWSKPLAAYRAARGRETTYLLDRNGHRSRLTDEAVLDDIVAVSAEVRAGIERRLAERGVAARGVVGADGGLLEAEVRPNMWWLGSELRRLENLVGPITRVDDGALRDLLAATDVLVVTPLARSAAHPRVNVDGDRAAARLAAALGAGDLVLLTDVDGVLFEGRVLARVRLEQLRPVVRAATGGMVKKLNAAATAVEGGVSRVVIGADAVASLLTGASGTEVIA